MSCHVPVAADRTLPFRSSGRGESSLDDEGESVGVGIQTSLFHISFYPLGYSVFVLGAATLYKVINHMRQRSIEMISYPVLIAMIEKCKLTQICKSSMPFPQMKASFKVPLHFNGIASYIVADDLICIRLFWRTRSGVVYSEESPDIPRRH